MNDFLNVTESQILYDTILVCPDVPNWEFNDGWFSSFAGIGAAIELPFLNVRNRNHGLPYNNQDTRDQMAYGMQVYSLGVRFFAPQIASQFLSAERVPTTQEEIHSGIWEADLPRHASVTLRLNQDERLKLQSCMAPCGYGPFGGGMGHGDPNNWSDTTGGQYPASIMKGCTTMGMPELTNQWPFPEPLDVPARATVAVVIKLSEYGRQLLQAMAGPLELMFWGSPTSMKYQHLKNSCFGIQVSMKVKRLIQQRGQYHAN